MNGDKKASVTQGSDRAPVAERSSLGAEHESLPSASSRPLPASPWTSSPWVVVAGLFTVLMVSSGFGFYNHSVYMASLAQSHGWALATLSGAVSLFFIVSGATGMAVARLIDRFDVRYTMAVGALVSGLALVLLGRADTVVQVYAAFALFGAGYSAVSLVPSTTLVARWFTQNRSVALSVTSTGLSAGGMLLTPLSVWLIGRLGFSQALLWFGCMFCVVVLPVIFLTVRPWPPGRQPERALGAALPASVDGVEYRVAVRGRYFGFVTATFVLLMLAQVGGIAHLFSLGLERVGAAAAGTAVSVLAVCSITGRLLGGVLITRLPMRAFTLANIVGQAGGLLLLSQATSTTSLWVGAAVFGLTVGNLLMLQPLLLADAFGLRSYSRIFAASQGLTTLGVAAGPAAVGALHDLTGGYQYALWAVAAISLFATAVFLLTGSAGPRKPLEVRL